MPATAKARARARWTGPTDGPPSPIRYVIDPRVPEILGVVAGCGGCLPTNSQPGGLCNKANGSAPPCHDNESERRFPCRAGVAHPGGRLMGGAYI
jgi:hypothetical protein